MYGYKTVLEASTKGWCLRPIEYRGPGRGSRVSYIHLDIYVTDKKLTNLIKNHLKSKGLYHHIPQITMRAFGILPIVPLEILPMVPLVAKEVVLETHRI